MSQSNYWIKRWIGKVDKVEFKEAYLEEGDAEYERPARFVASVDPGYGLSADLNASR